MNKVPVILTCPNCGGDRFNILGNLGEPMGLMCADDGTEMPGLAAVPIGLDDDAIDGAWAVTVPEGMDAKGLTDYLPGKQEGHDHGSQVHHIDHETGDGSNVQG